jgi:hypothetical protein
MRIALIIFSIFFTMNAYGQNLVQQLANINTAKQAKNFISKNPLFEGKLLEINSGKDTSAYFRQFFEKRSGDIFTIGTVTCKIISESATLMSRVNYLILDGTQLSFKKIEPLRKYILDEYNKGVPFDSLVAKYSMDGNKDFGDTDWFEDGVMAKEFELAVKQHRRSEVFTADVPASKWYFVIKKTFDTQQIRQMTVLQLKSGG